MSGSWFGLKFQLGFIFKLGLAKGPGEMWEREFEKWRFSYFQPSHAGQLVTGRVSGLSGGGRGTL